MKKTSAEKKEDKDKQAEAPKEGGFVITEFEKKAADEGTVLLPTKDMFCGNLDTIQTVSNGLSRPVLVHVYVLVPVLAHVPSLSLSLTLFIDNEVFLCLFDSGKERRENEADRRHEVGSIS